MRACVFNTFKFMQPIRGFLISYVRVSQSLFQVTKPLFGFKLIFIWWNINMRILESSSNRFFRTLSKDLAEPRLKNTVIRIWASHKTNIIVSQLSLCLINDASNLIWFQRLYLFYGLEQCFLTYLDLQKPSFGYKTIF